MNYGYDFNTDQLLSLSSEVDGVSNVNRFKYKRNLLESIEHDGFKVSYTHDKQGRRLETKVNDETYLSTEYSDNFTLQEVGVYYGSEIKHTYNNGHVSRSISDIDGKLKRVYSDSNYKTISYDDRDNVTNIVCNDSYINKSFTYDEYDNVLTEANSSRYSKSYEYDDRRRVSHEVNTYSSKTFNYDYTYNDEVKELLDEVVLNVDDVNVKKELEYDSLNRVSEQSLIINDEEFIKDEFEYLTVEDNALSLVKEHNILFKGTLSESNTYEYDLNGNIIKVVTDDDETRYHYDSLNRLIREDNPSLVKTYVYKYDKRGNILLRKEYNYTLEKDLFNPIKVDKFTYSKDGWKDQLIKYNDEEFVYDSMGRPTTYRGMTTYWNTDGTLVNMGGKYAYIRRNMDGMFFERRVAVSPYNMLTTTVQNDKILSDGPLTFIYILEKLVGFIYNGSRYYYQRNIQGDITHIYGEGGELVAKYVYDAYGRHKVLDASLQEDTNASSIGNLNPFRYRGYFYDSVLGLYFLKSRYYDPETCRFISPDIISILDETSSSINGLNLYMYCGDNPVMYVDPTGHFAITVGFLVGSIIAGAVAGALSNCAIAYFQGERGWDLFFDVVGGAVFGAAIGATVALAGAAGLAYTGAELAVGTSTAVLNMSVGTALGVSVGVTAFASATKYSLDCADSDRQWNLGGYLTEAGQGALQGITTFGLAYLGGQVGLFNKLGKFSTPDVFFTQYGGMNSLRAFVWGSKVLLGEFLARMILISGIGAGARWVIDKMIPEF